MDSEKEKNVQIKNEFLAGVENKSKSAERLTNEVKTHKNKHQKQEKEYKVGNYLIKNTLGSGTFGKVKLGIHIPSKKKVAVKILEKSKMTEKDDQIRLEREFEMLAQFNHPNLIMVTEIFESNNNYYTVMDYCEGGELFNYIVKKKYLSELEASFFYYQIISGLEYIHSLGIVHRDLKPENLLLTKDHILKIIDFGLSNYFKEGQNDLLYTPCGSPCYASPEMVSGNNYDGVMIDIWSTGIILFAMLCGYLPFEDKNNEKLFKKIAECKIEYPEYLSETALDLLKRIIVPNPKKRITINEIKKHPFYLKGKHLFDQEFTIQYFSDDNSNTEKNGINNNNDKNNQKDINTNNKENKEDKEVNNNNKDDKNINEKKEIKEIKEIKEKNEKIEKKETKEKTEKKEKKGKKEDKDNIEIKKQENKENQNININIDIINKHSFIENKTQDKSFNSINNNLSKSNNKTIKNKVKNNLSNNIIKINDISDKKLKDKDIKKKDYNKKTNNTFIDKISKDFSYEKTKLNNNKTNNEISERKIFNNTNINKKNNHNEKHLINSFNIQKLEEIKNNTIEIESIQFKNNDLNLYNNANTNINNKKYKKLADKNYLIIEDLNNSVDNKKIKKKNNNINTNSNYNLKRNRDKNKKTKEMENDYCSNTYNNKKTKNILKGNKVLNNVLGKILKINIMEQSKEKKENIKNKENKKIEEDLNKIINKRNTYCEGDSKIFKKQKINAKQKERKTEIITSKKKSKLFNPTTKFFILNPYNYHKLTMSTDIKNNYTQIDINQKKNLLKNMDNIYIYENYKGHKSIRQELYPTGIKKIEGKKSYIEKLKINTNSNNKDKYISYPHQINNDFQDYTLKTEANEILHTDIGKLDNNSKYKFKMNNNLLTIETKLSQKDTNKQLKKSFYKNQNNGIYSCNNLNYSKINKDVYQNISNEDRLTSNKKRNFKKKFNNFTNLNNFYNSENKTKKCSNIFIHKKTYNIENLINIENSYSSKINDILNYKSNFINYNNNINNSKEKKSSSKNKNLNNKKILNFSNKNPMCYMEDGISSIDFETKNKNINMNTIQTNKTNNNLSPRKYVRQIKKNNNYIHIMKKQVKSGKVERNKSKSITKSKTKQKTISRDEPFNFIENTNFNSIRNPFERVTNTSLTNAKPKINRQKINLKKNNIYEINNNNTNNINNNNANPLLNINNTFISFNMYPKYYLDPKKQLSFPKITPESPQFKKNINSNIKISANKIISTLSNNNHLRKNTSPGIDSPQNKYEVNNFMKIQQNILNNIDNQKIVYYTNTEYGQDINFPKNINLDTLRNINNKLINKKNIQISSDISSNNKINKMNINNNKNSNISNNNLSNTISPKNKKKNSKNLFNNINNNNNILDYNKINANNMNININSNDNIKKNKKHLTNFVINYENNLNKKNNDYEIIAPQKNDMINELEKINFNTIENRDLSEKFGMDLKFNKNF